MQSKWLPINQAFAVIPPSLTTGDGRNPILPDPPDPPDPIQYPPLSPSIPSSSKTSTKPITSSSLKNPSNRYTAPVLQEAAITDVEIAISDSTVQISGSALSNSQPSKSNSGSENYNVMPPKKSSPLQTNRTSSSQNHPLLNHRSLSPPIQDPTTPRDPPPSAPPAPTSHPVPLAPFGPPAPPFSCSPTNQLPATHHSPSPPPRC